ncbi:MAG: polysaccharide biosynthesis/export family protein [Candidatus Deferrimicrobiaceae bacterium]
MKVGKRLAVAILLAAMTPIHLYAEEKKEPAPVAASPAVPETGYRIGPGDILNIEVWKDNTLSRPVTVLPDGKISFPLIGELTAGDRTVAELKKEIEAKILRYVPDSPLTVEVRQVNSLHIYVLGRVNAPGRFILSSNVTVLQALAIAGGPNAFANRSKIRIFREKSGKTTMSPPFDYDEVTAGRNIQTNVLLERGDVIFVP